MKSVSTRGASRNSKASSAASRAPCAAFTRWVPPVHAPRTLVMNGFHRTLDARFRLFLLCVRARAGRAWTGWPPTWCAVPVKGGCAWPAARLS